MDTWFAIPHPIYWLLLWWVSAFVQFAGLLVALREWQREHRPGWRHFWLLFVVNWLFTLAHQCLGVLLRPYVMELSEMLGWGMKLGAMICELGVMHLAQRLARGEVVPRASAAEGE